MVDVNADEILDVSLPISMYLPKNALSPRGFVGRRRLGLQVKD